MLRKWKLWKCGKAKPREGDQKKPVWRRRPAAAIKERKERHRDNDDDWQFLIRIGEHSYCKLVFNVFSVFIVFYSIKLVNHLVSHARLILLFITTVRVGEEGVYTITKCVIHCVMCVHTRTHTHTHIMIMSVTYNLCKFPRKTITRNRNTNKPPYRQWIYIIYIYRAIFLLMCVCECVFVSAGWTWSEYQENTRNLFSFRCKFRHRKQEK